MHLQMRMHIAYCHVFARLGLGLRGLHRFTVAEAVCMLRVLRVLGAQVCHEMYCLVASREWGNGVWGLFFWII